MRSYSLLVLAAGTLLCVNTCGTAHVATVAGVVPSQLPYLAAATRNNGDSYYTAFNYDMVRVVAETLGDVPGGCALGTCALRHACDDAARMLLTDWAQTHTIDASTHALGSLLEEPREGEGQQIQDCRVTFVNVPPQGITSVAKTSTRLSHVAGAEKFVLPLEGHTRQELEESCVMSTQVLAQSLGANACTGNFLHASGILGPMNHKNGLLVSTCEIDLNNLTSVPNQTCDVPNGRLTQAYTVSTTGMTAALVARACDNAARERLAQVREAHCADTQTRATGDLVGPLRGIPAHGMASRCLVTLTDMPL